MSMLPEDVKATRFREGWRGYDEDEVDDFMARVGHALQVLIAERDEATTRAEQLAQEADGVRENERLLRRTLLTAERTAEETVGRAEEEAERIRSEARADAERLRIEAHEHARHELGRARDMAERIREAITEFRALREAYRGRIHQVVTQQLAALDRIGELPDLPDDVIRFEDLAALGSDPAESTDVTGSALDEGPDVGHVPSVLAIEHLDGTPGGTAADGEREAATQDAASDGGSMAASDGAHDRSGDHRSP